MYSVWRLVDNVSRVVRIHRGCPIFLSMAFTWFAPILQFPVVLYICTLPFTVLDRRLELDLLRISREGLSVLSSRNGPLTLTSQLNLSFSIFVLYVLYERTSGRSTDTETRGCALSSPLTSITDGITVLYQQMPIRMWAIRPFIGGE